MEEILSLANKVIGIVTPFLKNKVFQKIGTDFSEAATNEGLLLWEKIKPIFIEEEEKKVMQQVEQQPNDIASVEALKFFLIQKLQQQQHLRNEIEQMLAAGQNSSKPTVQMTHYGTGDQFTGNKIITYQSEPKV